MISIETIEREIDEIVATHDTTYATCERLAWLYIVRDHLRPTSTPEGIKAPEISPLSGSEFLDAANGKPYEDVMKVIDEHLETIKLLYPKTFSAILDKIRQL